MDKNHYKIPVIVLIALNVLLLMTVSLHYVPEFIFKPFLTFVIASAKAGLVLTFFMHIYRSKGITRFYISSGFIWLLFLLILTGADYLTR